MLTFGFAMIKDDFCFSSLFLSNSKGDILQKAILVRSLSAKDRPDRYRRDKSVKFGRELP